MISDDFIFGRSGRGLLLGDRIAFGRTILEKIYAAILATEPTVFIPLEYAVNPDTGEQILFQDAACTVDIDTIGQQIGGVKWDGVIVATQSTDARRPQWLGLGSGAFFDGVDNELDLTDDFSAFSAAHLFVSLKLAADPPASAAEIGLWSFNPVGVDDTAFPFTDGNIYESAFTGTRAAGVDPGVDLSADYHTYQVASDAASYDQWVGDSLIQSSSARFSVPRATPEIGRSISNTGSSRFLNGNIRALVVYDRRVSTSESESIRGDLA